MDVDRLVVDVMGAGVFELELGLMQTQMAQKPMLMDSGVFTPRPYAEAE
jgi:hypothetical protein